MVVMKSGIIEVLQTSFHGSNPCYHIVDIYNRKGATMIEDKLYGMDMFDFDNISESNNIIEERLTQLQMIEFCQNEIQRLAPKCEFSFHSGQNILGKYTSNKKIGKIISLNIHLFESMDFDNIRKVLYHEIAHYYTRKKYQNAKPHGTEWISECLKLGMEIEDISRCYETRNVEYLKKYIVSCPACNNNFRIGRINRNSLYWCREYWELRSDKVDVDITYNSGEKVVPYPIISKR